MAKFQIYLKQNNKEILLTDYNSNTTNTVDNTYNEEIDIQENMYCTLNFDMNLYVIKNNHSQENILCSLVKEGSEIIYRSNNNQYNFIVLKKQYTLNTTNVSISYSCQDIFSFLMAKRNNGYEITNDTSSSSYIGALSLDGWAKKIQKECFIDWKYINIDSFNHYDVSLNERRSFSVSGSNAYNALVSLGEEYDLYLYIDFATKSFAFQPKKSPQFSGLYFSPKTNIQSLNITSDNNELATILNVQGGTDADDNEIMLIPDVPPDWVQYFGTSDWENTYYTGGLYNSLVQPENSHYLYDNNGNITYCVSPSVAIKIDHEYPIPYNVDNYNFATQIENIPYLENKLINLSYFKNNKNLLSDDYNELIDFIYNKLRILRGKMMHFTSLYVNEYSETSKTLSEWIINSDNLLMNCDAILDMYNNSLQGESFDSDDLTLINTYVKEINELAPSCDLTGQNIKILDFDDKMTDLANDYDNAYYILINSLYNFYVQLLSYQQKLGDTSIEGDVEILYASSLETITNYWNKVVSYGKYCGYYFPDDWMEIFINEKNTISGSVNSVQYKSTTYKDIFDYLKFGNITKGYRKIWLYHKNNQYGDVDGYLHDLSTPWFDNTTYTLDNNPWYYVNELYEKTIYDNFDLSYFTYSNWINRLNDALNLTCTNVIKGLYEQKFDNLFNNCVEYYYGTDRQYTINGYQLYQNQYTELWTTIYQKYGNYLYSASYENTDATNSQLLYNAAKNYLSNLTAPEPTFDLSVINLSNLQYDTMIDIQLTKYIILRSSDFSYLDNDNDLKDILDMKLYITGIKQTCRKDSDIQLTVDRFKYSEKIIKNLINLL